MINFTKNQLHPFTINGHEYKGYSDYWFMFEQVMEEEPQRSSGNGAMSNITDINRIEVPHLWVDFSHMPIDVFRQFCIDTKPVEFIVECYDIIYDRIVSNKMYITPMERQKLRNYGKDILGILDMKIELIGTNNSMDEVVITYDSNPPFGTNRRQESQSVLKGLEFIIKQPFVDYTGYSFTKWTTNSDGTGQSFLAGNANVANIPMTLYAQYQGTDIRTLSYNYGEGEITKDDENNPILNKEVHYGKAVGELPNVIPKQIYYKDKQIREPYDFMGWYSIYGGQGSKWTSSTIYNIEGNATIYAYMKPQEFTITFNSQGGNYTPKPITQPYASNVYAPYAPERTGYTFLGWYTDANNDDNDTNYVFNIMPPENITVYAHWRKNEND